MQNDEFLRDKINLLTNQIQQEEQSRFLHELIVKDAEGLIGDPAIDRQLKVQAQNSRAAIKVHEHKLAIRRKLLVEFQAQYDAQESAKENENESSV